MRRLTGDKHLTHGFATTWRGYDLDPKTRALLEYAHKLTTEPSMIEDSDVETLRAVGWDDRGIYEATALVALFNLTGRMEAASGMPPDEVPLGSRLAEARAEATKRQRRRIL